MVTDLHDDDKNAEKFGKKALETENSKHYSGLNTLSCK